MRDADVRRALLCTLEDQHGDEPDTRIVQEMGVWSGSVRIDVAVINGELTGFEIKSDRDTLDRLPVQADLYSRVFDRVHLVVGERYAAKARRLLPDWWGITVARARADSLALFEDREAGRNPDPEPYLVAQLMWRAEALALLDRYGLAKGFRSKTAEVIHNRLARELPFDVLARHVRETLKRREGWLGKSVGDKPEVPVDHDAGPGDAAAGIGRPVGDGPDMLVGDAPAQSAERRLVQ